MSEIIVQDSSLQQFTGLTTIAEVRDQQGRLLGHFLPAGDAETLANLSPAIDEAEMHRRIAAGGGRSLAEIWKRLGVAK
jgi:hypothetical protein